MPDHWSPGLDFTFSGGVTKLPFRGASGEDLAPAFGEHDQPHVDSQTQAEKACQGTWRILALYPRTPLPRLPAVSVSHQ